MSYYHCPTNELYKEIHRRGYIPDGSQEILSEWLHEDDEERGSEATTIETSVLQEPFAAAGQKRTAYGEIVQPSALVGEEIIYWTMNTFFPTLQLFFRSGRSCTIACARQQGTDIGLDRNLRFRLTDLSHEEDGIVVRSVLPKKLLGPNPSVRIVAAEVAQRWSVRVKPLTTGSNRRSPMTPPTTPKAEIIGQRHVVVGIKLVGMRDMGYIWARAGADGNSGSQAAEEPVWANVWMSGLRDDVPPPILGMPQSTAEVGAMVQVVTKRSLISERARRGEG